MMALDPALSEDETLLGCAIEDEMEEGTGVGVGVASVGAPNCKAALLADPSTISRALPSLLDQDEDKEEDGVKVKEKKSRASKSSRKSKSKSDMTVIEKLKAAAATLAFQGSEQKAIKMYRKALSIAKSDVNSIKHKISKTHDGENWQSKQALNADLHQKWQTVARDVANIRTMQAILHERLGDYDSAMTCCQEAKDIYESQLKLDELDGKVRSHSRDHVDQLYSMITKLERARQSFPTRNELHQKVIAINKEIDSSYDAEKEKSLLSDQFQTLSSLLSVELDCLGEIHPQIADTLTKMSQVCLRRGDEKKARETMHRAINISEICLGGRHPRTAQKYVDVARVIEKGDSKPDDAIAYYKKAIDCYRKTGSDRSKEIGLILNDMGILYIHRKEYKKALGTLKRALESYESSTLDELYAESAMVWRNIAECRILQKNWKDAIEATNSALQSQKKARKMFEMLEASGANPWAEVSPLVKDESIGDTLKKLGSIYAIQGNFQQAALTLTEALMLLQSSFEKAKEQRVENRLSLAKRQDQIAHTLFTIADIKEKAGDLEEARRLYDESYQLRQFTDTQRKDGKRLNRVHSAMCLAGVGSIYLKREEYGSAFKTFNKAIQLCKAQDLPQIHPIYQMIFGKSQIAGQRMREDSQKIQQSVPIKAVDNQTEEEKGRELKKSAGANEQKGRKLSASKVENTPASLKRKGDLDGAIESALSALKINEEYVVKREKAKRDSTNAKRQLARSQVMVARLYASKGDGDKSILHYSEAIQMYLSSGKIKASHTCIQEIKNEMAKLEPSRS